MLKRRLPVIAAVLFVLLAYAFFGSDGHFQFRSRPWHMLPGRPADGYYNALTEGFLRGQLDMAHKPHPKLLEMPHPYDHKARDASGVPYLWDASYLNGRYYLYFTPVPVFFVYLPFHFVYGDYPSDQFAATVFAAWAFLAGVAFLRRALQGRTLHVPMPLWIVMLGLANVVPFIMVFSRTYEVATLCGMAMTATWAWCLLRYLESRKTSTLVWTSLWLGLAIASRPNLGIILPVFAYAIWSAGISPAGSAASRRRAFVVALIPLSIIGSSLLLYNYQRYGEPLEFGHRYQLTYMPMAEHRVCGLCNRAEALRLINTAQHYLFSSPAIGGDFPFVALPFQWLDPKISFSDRSEAVGGLAPMAPLAVIGSLFALIVALRREPRDTGTRASLLVLAAGWLALVGLSACWFVTARYELDFWLLITVGAIVGFEAGLTLLGEAGVSLRPLRAAAIILACYSILLGFFLGFRGTNDEFRAANPELFRRISELF